MTNRNSKIDKKLAVFVDKACEISPMTKSIHQNLYVNDNFYQYGITETSNIEGLQNNLYTTFGLDPDTRRVVELEICMNPQAGLHNLTTGLHHETTHVKQIWERERLGLDYTLDSITFIGITIINEVQAFNNQIEGPLHGFLSCNERRRPFDGVNFKGYLNTEGTASGRDCAFTNWYIAGLLEKDKEYGDYPELAADLKGWAAKNYSGKSMQEKEDHFTRARKHFAINLLSQQNPHSSKLIKFYVGHTIEENKKNEQNLTRGYTRLTVDAFLPSLKNNGQDFLSDDDWEKCLKLNDLKENSIDKFVHRLSVESGLEASFKLALENQGDRFHLE